MTKKTIKYTHQEDLDARYGIHELDRAQVASVKKTVDEVCKKLDAHIVNNDISEAANIIFREKWDILLPDLAIVVEEKKDQITFNRGAAKIARLIVVIASGIIAVLAAVVAISKLIVWAGTK